MNEERPDSMRVFILPTIYTTVFILTDDQDLKLGSLAFQPKVRTLLTEQGLTFNNAFVNTPVCCPSRFVGCIAGHFLYTFATYVALPCLSFPALTSQVVHSHGQVRAQSWHVREQRGERVQRPVMEGSQRVQDHGRLHVQGRIQDWTIRYVIMLPHIRKRYYAF